MQSIKKPYIEDFYKNESYLNILERRKPYDADRFFQNILSETFQINASIAKKEAYNAIKYLLKKQLPNKIQDNIFYYKWIKDMSEICILYSDIIKEDTITFSLKTSRGCKRYHIDNVPVRLLVTYYGKGTEWLPRNACDYAAYYNGENNDKIVKIKMKEKKLFCIELLMKH